MSTHREVKSLFKASDQAAPVENSTTSIARMGEVDQFDKAELDQLKIIYGGMQNAKALNVFRELRTQLLQKNNKKNFICMVTSTCHGGGASYIAANLATVFALDKAKTSMLIDTNLYAPSLEKLIIGEATDGITDYLNNPELSIKDVVYATGIPRLRAIPIGANSEGAAEYFSSEKMLGFVEEVRSRYSDRFIFLDAPPITVSSEARILAEIADMVILVVPYGRSTPEQVEFAIDIVGKNKLSGLVYNN